MPNGEIPTEPIALPGGLGNLTHGEGVRRGVGYAAGMKNVCYSHGFDDFLDGPRATGARRARTDRARAHRSREWGRGS